MKTAHASHRIPSLRAPAQRVRPPERGQIVHQRLGFAIAQDADDVIDRVGAFGRIARRDVEAGVARDDDASSSVARAGVVVVGVDAEVGEGVGNDEFSREVEGHRGAGTRVGVREVAGERAFGSPAARARAKARGVIADEFN